MAEPGVSSCMEGFGTKENLEEEMEILSAIMTDRRCTKVATFVKDNVESLASSGAFDSFQLFLSLMQTTYNDKWFQDLCAIRTEARQCVNKVIIPAVRKYLKNRSDGCCVGVWRSDEVQKGLSIAKELAGIGNALVCDRRQVMKGESRPKQTCGYTFLQGVLENVGSPIDIFRNMMPLMQISTKNVCAAFWGKKYKNTNRQKQFMFSSLPLRNCARGYDLLFTFIEKSFNEAVLFMRKPKNQMRMSHK